MGIVDIVLCMCLVPALIIGMVKGFAKQLIALLAIYLGITLSLRFADSVSTWLLQYITMTPFWLKIISFLIIWTAVALILGILGRVLQKILKVTMLGWLNRLLGALASAAIAILLLSLLVYLADALNGLFKFLPQREIAESKLFPMLLDAAKSIFPHLKQLF